MAANKHSSQRMRIHEALNTPGTKSLSFESANLTDWIRLRASFGIAPSNVERATLSFETRDCQRACAGCCGWLQAVPGKKGRTSRNTKSPLLQRAGEHLLKCWPRSGDVHVPVEQRTVAHVRSRSAAWQPSFRTWADVHCLVVAGVPASNYSDMQD